MVNAEEVGFEESEKPPHAVKATVVNKVPNRFLVFIKVFTLKLQ
jgi:hypothetical protein